VTTPTTSETPQERERRALRPAAAWLLAAVALAPFALPYVAHYAGGAGATGFLQVDMPYYAANGREIFERGNGWLHPNPYEPGPDPPAIYFHWFTWLLGFGIARLGLDPGTALLALGAVGALLFARVTLRIVAAVLDDPAGLVPLYLLVMWGGGVLCLGRVVENAVAGRGLADALLAHDPHGGQWFLSWGRNAVLPTEAVFHALSATILLALLRARWWPALAATAALAATHPWSGAQLLAITGAWAGVGLLRRPGSAAILAGLAWAALATGFAWYYGRFLPSFDEHRVLSAQWTSPWTMPAASALLAYGPIGLLAAWRCVADRRVLDARAGVLIAAFLVSLALVKHDLFLGPVQPLHFTRGYVWLPLCLLALPLVQRALLAARARRRPAVLLPVAAALSLVAVGDNAGAIGTALALPRLGLRLPASDREMLRWLDAQRFDGVLLCEDPRLSYLSATYSPARPYCGHLNNTPDALTRLSQLARWRSGDDPGAWDPPPDAVLVRHAGGAPLPPGADWTLRHENEDWALYARAAGGR
jgi:hypothetical protein